MAQSEDAPACKGEGGGGSYTLQDSLFSEKELAELVKRTYKRIIELDDQLDKVKTHGTRFFRIFDAKTKEGAMLIRYLELAGISFSGTSAQKHIFDLMNDLKKEVEEVVKNAKHLR